MGLEDGELPVDDDELPDAARCLEPATERVAGSIRGVHARNIANLEWHIGRLVLEAVPRLSRHLLSISHRDRRAVLYLLVEEMQRYMFELGHASQYLPPLPEQTD